MSRAWLKNLSTIVCLFRKIVAIEHAAHEWRADELSFNDDC